MHYGGRMDIDWTLFYFAGATAILIVYFLISYAFLHTLVSMNSIKEYMRRKGANSYKRENIVLLCSGGISFVASMATIFWLIYQYHMRGYA